LATTTVTSATPKRFTSARCRFGTANARELIKLLRNLSSDADSKFSHSLTWPRLEKARQNYVA